MNKLAVPGLAPLLLGILWVAQLQGGESWRIATYNVRNYLVTDRMVEGSYRFAYPKPEAEKAGLRRVIAEADADVLAIQEIGGWDYLQELQRDLGEDGVTYPYLALMEAADEDRMTAVLSRYPWIKARRHAALEFYYLGSRERPKRGFLELEFDTNGVRWSLFVLHLKSRFTDNSVDPESERRRIREAEVMRNLIKNRWETGKGHYLVLGDFNDGPRSSAVRRFLTVGSRKLSEIVPARDACGWDWTYHNSRDSRYEAIDFILASPRMAEHVLEGSGFIVDIAEAGWASDHRLVACDLSF